MSNKEIEDLKTLIKALEIRLHADEISEAEYKELKEKYETKLQEELVAVKEHSFLRNMELQFRNLTWKKTMMTKRTFRKSSNW